MRHRILHLAHVMLGFLDSKRQRWSSQLRGSYLSRRCLADPAWLLGFQQKGSPDRQAYADLFRYFLAGFLTYRSPLGAHADYKGMGSYNGPAMDRLEGFSRIAPLLAAWLAGGRPSQVEVSDRCVDLVEILRAGLVEGTNPSSPEYWGPIRHWSQAIVESADLALTLWLTRPLLWDRLETSERTRIATWLVQVNGKRIPDNNWHLFIVQVNAVLASLGQDHDPLALAEHYQRAKSFYRGEGWFQDGEGTKSPGYDFYNAWGFHYHLQWIDRISPGLDDPFISDTFRAFLSSYVYMIGPEGLPIIGRSACYRMATPAPLVLGQDRHQDVVSPGQARRALDATWSYFIRHGALQNGNVTQGYFHADPRLLENYSGPASCLWSLRSLVAALALPDSHPFWNASPEPLPVEVVDYEVRISPPGWTVTGQRASNCITLATGNWDMPNLSPHTLKDRFLEQLTLRPRRPDNVRAKYYRSVYKSDSPYGLQVGETKA